MELQHVFSGGREIFRELVPGLTMFFQFHNQKTNYKTAYVGLAPGDAVIMRLPLNPGIIQQLSEAYTVVVRFVHAGQAYGFESRFLAAFRKPIPLLFLTFPQSVHRVSLRQSERLSLLEKAAFTVGENRTECLLTDLSRGGCQLRLPRNETIQGLAPGSEATVEFNLSLEERVPVALKGKILHMEADGKKMKCRMAFHSDQERELSQLDTYLQSILRMLWD